VSPSGTGEDRETIRRVGLVISQLRAGGAERVVVHLASALRTQGISTEIICLNREGVLAGEARRNGVPVVSLGSARGYDLSSISLMAKQFRRFRPDVINLHDRASLPYVAIANRLAGRRPLVLTCHGLLLEDRGRPRIRDRLFVRDVQAVTAVSEQAAREYAKLFGWRDEVPVLPNGVPLTGPSTSHGRAVREDLGLPEGTFLFLAVGNVKPEKGYEDLLAAAGCLRAHLPERPFAVLIAGGVTARSYWDELHGLQARLGLRQTVRFLGLRPDTLGLYAAADAFVLSSRTEGLPMALLEAMSAGLPVVATRVGAVPEVLNGDCGLLAGPGRPQDLADAMQQLVVSESLRRRLGRRAHGRVKARYGVQAMAREYLRAYHRARTRTRGAPIHAPRRPRVLMLGPLPPLTGGMATVTANLRSSPLRDLCQLTVMNNGKTTTADRPFWQGVASQVALLANLARTALFCRAELAHIHTCALFSFWRDTVHMLALLGLDCRVIWHIHDGTFLKFLSEGNRVKRAAIRWAMERSVAAIVLSEESHRNLQPHAPRVNWRVVPNGVPVPLVPARTHDEIVRFLFLGNMTRRKGAYDLIEATEAAVARGARLLVQIAGREVVPGQRDEVARRIAASPCPASFELLGLVTGAAKEQALAQGECIVLPSYAEGLPMALLEGMSHGMAAVATCVGSVPELIEDGVQGFVVRPGDVDALADRMCRLATDRPLCLRMGSAAQERVRAEYSLEAVADSVMRVYAAALNGVRVADRGPCAAPGCQAGKGRI